MIFFLLAALAHIFQLIRRRTWYFVVLMIGILTETLRCLARFANECQTPDYTLGAFIAQSLLILIAPGFVAATLYMTFRRIILATDGEKYSFIKRRWLTKIFLVSDVVRYFYFGCWLFPLYSSSFLPLSC